jgi:hypothetical protein
MTQQEYDRLSSVQAKLLATAEVGGDQTVTLAQAEIDELLSLLLCEFEYNKVEEEV